MFKRMFYSLSVLFISYFTATVSASEVEYDRYLNGRFSYGISYPVGVLEPLEEAQNGDGRGFRSKDGKTMMLAYGSNNVLFNTLSDVFLQEIERESDDGQVRDVTYKALRTNWFVVSGTEGDSIFYTKVIYNKGENQFIYFRISYPDSQREIYDPVVSEVSKSMRILGRSE